MWYFDAPRDYWNLNDCQLSSLLLPILPAPSFTLYKHLHTPCINALWPHCCCSTKFRLYLTHFSIFWFFSLKLMPVFCHLALSLWSISQQSLLSSSIVLLHFGIFFLLVICYLSALHRGCKAIRAPFSFGTVNWESLFSTMLFALVSEVASLLLKRFLPAPFTHAFLNIY